MSTTQPVQHPRVALLVDPLTMNQRGGEHAPELARELIGRGYAVRGFGAPRGHIPRSDGAQKDAVAEEREAEGQSGLAAFRPDVLFAYDALSPTAWMGARTARRLKSPLVLIEPALDESGEPLYRRMLHGVGQRLWGRYVRSTAAAVVALDPVAEQRALAEGFAPDRVQVLPRGIDLGHFRPGLTSALMSQHQINDRVLLYVGRLEESQGLTTLITAFARTVGQRGDWSLVLAGEGHGVPQLRAHVRRLGIGTRVQWLARPRREELPGLFGASTLLAVPALDDRVLGKQIPRAMACGLPVLASDLPRLRFLVDDGETGALIPPGVTDAWTSTLQRVAAAPTARRRWGDRARERAVERFAWSAVADQFDDLIRGAIDGHTSSEVPSQDASAEHSADRDLNRDSGAA